MENVRELFSKNFRVALRNAGVTQTHLAKLMGIHVTSIQKWLNGRSWPTSENIEEISRHLGLHPGELFAPEGSKPIYTPETALKFLADRLGVNLGQTSGKTIDVSGVPDDKMPLVELVVKELGEGEELHSVAEKLLSSLNS